MRKKEFDLIGSIVENNWNNKKNLELRIISISILIEIELQDLFKKCLTELYINRELYQNLQN